MQQVALTFSRWCISPGKPPFGWCKGVALVFSHWCLSPGKLPFGWCKGGSSVQQVALTTSRWRHSASKSAFGWCKGCRPCSGDAPTFSRWCLSPGEHPLGSSKEGPPCSRLHLCFVGGAFCQACPPSAGGVRGVRCAAGCIDVHSAVPFIRQAPPFIKMLCISSRRRILRGRCACFVRHCFAGAVRLTCCPILAGVSEQTLESCTEVQATSRSNPTWGNQRAMTTTGPSTASTSKRRSRWSVPSSCRVCVALLHMHQYLISHRFALPGRGTGVEQARGVGTAR